MPDAEIDVHARTAVAAHDDAGEPGADNRTRGVADDVDPGRAAPGQEEVLGRLDGETEQRVPRDGEDDAAGARAEPEAPHEPDRDEEGDVDRHVLREGGQVL